MTWVRLVKTLLNATNIWPFFVVHMIDAHITQTVSCSDSLLLRFAKQSVVIHFIDWYVLVALKTFKKISSSERVFNHTDLYNDKFQNFQLLKRTRYQTFELRNIQMKINKVMNNKKKKKLWTEKKGNWEIKAPRPDPS